MIKLAKVLLVIVIICLSVLLYTITTTKTASANIKRSKDNPYYVVLDGVITKETFIALKKEYRRKPFHGIIATSPGGDYPTGIAIAKFVYNNEIAVYVPEFCHSSCSFMAMTTPKLMMEPDAIIGIHNLSFEVGDGEDENTTVTLKTAIGFAKTASVYAGQMFALYAMAGIPPEYLADASQKSGGDMVRLTEPQLKSWGIAKDFETIE